MNVGDIVKSSFIASYLFTWTGAYLKITHTGRGDDFLLVGIIASLAFIIAAIYEVRTSERIDNREKALWIIAFIFFSGIAGLIYIIFRRKRVISNS